MMTERNPAPLTPDTVTLVTRVRDAAGEVWAELAATCTEV
jgi:hypothetical protein